MFVLQEPTEFIDKDMNSSHKGKFECMRINTNTQKENDCHFLIKSTKFFKQHNLLTNLVECTIIILNV